MSNVNNAERKEEEWGNGGGVVGLGYIGWAG